MQTEISVRQFYCIEWLEITDGNSQLFLTLSDQAFFQAFARFLFAAGEFPEQTTAFAGGSLTDHDGIFVSQDCGCNL